MRFTGTATAAKLKISRRTFHDHMARNGAPSKGSDGLWDFAECAAFIINHLGNVAGGREKVELDDDALDLERERARVAKHQADKLEMENQVSRGEFLPRAEVTSTWQALIMNSKTKLLAIPSKAAPGMVGLKSPREAQDKLTKIIHESLADLAETRAVPQGARRVGNGDGGNRSNGDVGPAAKADRERMGGSKPPPKPRSKRGAGPMGHIPG